MIVNKKLRHIKKLDDKMTEVDNTNPWSKQNDAYKTLI